MSRMSTEVLVGLMSFAVSGVGVGAWDHDVLLIVGGVWVFASSAAGLWTRADDA